MYPSRMQQAILRHAVTRCLGRMAVCKGSSTVRTTIGHIQIIQRGVHCQNASHTKQIDKKFAGTISKVELNQNNAMVEVTLSDGKNLNYPWVWLRDNCQCSSCFNSHLHSRTIHWRYFDISVKPTTISTNDGKLSITWSDSHESHFTLNWLQERSFTQESRDKWLEGTYRLPKVPWGSAEFPNILKKFDFNDVIQSDNTLLEWLQNLATHGVAILTDTPAREDQMRRLANRVCFIKRTHYGEEFEVRNKPDTTNLAYLSTPLQMHTDLPYYEYKPGVNMLHCLVQTLGEGGENELTDILNVSNKLKHTQPDVYNTLASTLVDWSDIGEDGGIRFHSLYRSPVLCEDHNGQFVRVNYSQQQRDSHFSVPLQDVIPWYKAHAIFTEAIYHPDNVVKFKTKAGEILTFDNIRLVHGRSGYEDSSENERHLIGAYLDWDIVYSRIRELCGTTHKY